MRLSSTWRKIKPYDQIAQMLVAQGLGPELKSRFIGQTPALWTRRGYEIQAWLDENPEYSPIAIVDDDSDMEHLSHRHVKTNLYENGLTNVEADALIRLLRESK